MGVIRLPTIDDLILQVVVQPKALAGEVFPDARHREIGAALPSELLRQGVAEMSGVIRPATHFSQ